MHKLIISSDGSLSAFNAEFGECYSSLSEGALGEKISKHIFPALLFLESKWQSSIESSLGFCLDSSDLPKESQKSQLKSSDFFGEKVALGDIWILDICFGLGYNAFLSALAFECLLQKYQKYFSQDNHNASATKKQPQKSPKLHIISLENDKNTLDLSREIFCIESSAWENLARGKVAQITPNVDMQILWGEACEVLEKLDFGEMDLKQADFKKNDLKKSDFGGFDIVFQDPFSFEKNPTLWSLEHFKRLFSLTKNECIITSYATKKEVLEVAKKAGFIPCKINPNKINIKILDFVVSQNQSLLKQGFQTHLQNVLKNRFDFEALFRVKKRRQSSVFSKNKTLLTTFA
ncbi:MnmC family methyltransferase [Helicobacter sp. T3_23-1059]